MKIPGPPCSSSRFVSNCEEGEALEVAWGEMAALPMDMITVILKRLPVRSLLCFTGVSNEWRDLMESPRFAKSHLSMSVESSTHLGLFLWQPSSLYRIHLVSLQDEVSIDEVSIDAVRIDHPLSRDRKIKVLGSCNGLLCICNEADRIVMRNPSTGTRKILPPRAQVGRALDFLYYGFGYDDRNDDYVLLRLYHRETEPMGSEVRIYSLKNDAWRQLCDIPCFLYYVHGMGVFVCGRLHWIMTRELVSDSAKMLVACDFRTEDLRVLDLPDVIIDDKLDMDVAVLRGCLCLSINDSHLGVDVWIMKEYGLKEPWAKLFSIPQSEVARPPVYVRPLVYSLNGRKVLVRLDDKSLTWYDLGTKCMAKVNIRGMPSSFEAEICFETLVSVHDAARIGREG